MEPWAPSRGLDHGLLVRGGGHGADDALWLHRCLGHCPGPVGEHPRDPLPEDSRAHPQLRAPHHLRHGVFEPPRRRGRDGTPFARETATAILCSLPWPPAVKAEVWTLGTGYLYFASMRQIVEEP